MDPLLQLRRQLKNLPDAISFHDNDGNQLQDISNCVYIKLGNFIFPRDQPTNYRSKRGAGDYYQLDAILFLLSKKEAAYGEYLQEARKTGVIAVSLVDRKDLLEYIEGDMRPEECNFVDTLAPLATPRRSFTDEGSTTANFMETEEVTSNSTIVIPLVGTRLKSRPSKPRDAVFNSGKDFTSILELAKEVQKSFENDSASLAVKASLSTNLQIKQQPVSLIEQIASANKPTSSIVSGMNSSSGGKGNSNAASSSSLIEKRSSFIPIIIVPATPTAMLTMFNVCSFLCDGQYQSVAEAKSKSTSKENTLMIEHKLNGMNQKVQIIDNPTRLGVEDWYRVVAVFVQGTTWQFKGWKWESPVELFQNVKGYSLTFDDTKPDPNVLQWNVQRLTISKSRRHLDTTAVFQFWSALEEFTRRKRGQEIK